MWNSMRMPPKGSHHLNLEESSFSNCLRPCCILTLAYLCGSVLAPSRKEGCQEATCLSWEPAQHEKFAGGIRKSSCRRRGGGRWQLMIQKAICMWAFCLTGGSMCDGLPSTTKLASIPWALTQSIPESWGNAQHIASTYLSWHDLSSRISKSFAFMRTQGFTSSWGLGRPVPHKLI